MNIVSPIIATILIVILVFLTLRLFSTAVIGIFRYLFKSIINRYFLYRKLKIQYRYVLENKFKFYNTLSDKEKIRFGKRVQKFIDMKDFVPKGELTKVNPEMKVLIAATAIQITYGYPYVYFKHFWRIFVFDNTYFSEQNQTYHKGEVNMKGIIALSWKSFEEGFMNENDGINLAYHEMAHALRLENAIYNSEYNFIDKNLLMEFTAKAKNEIKRIQNGDSVFFRHYASVNHQEFFAVVVENFFERPHEFKLYDEYLYHLTARLLRQDSFKI